MKNQTKYLCITMKSLVIRYGAIYFALTMAILFSSHSPLLFSIGYWVIFGTLMYLEGRGSYIVIGDKEVVWYSWFFFRIVIPMTGIKSLEKGEFYGIGHPECIVFKFKLVDGRESVGYILPYQHARGDVKKFVGDLSHKAPQMMIDQNIERWF